MKITRAETTDSISETSSVRFKEMGNIFEVMNSEKRSSGGYIRKIDKDTFIDTRSGELREFNHILNRSQDLNNVAKSLAKGRDILNTNITDVSHCRWVTLTYAENMTDPERLAIDFQNFNRRCRKIFGHYEYITAAEPQGRGAWHLHCVFIFDGPAPYMDNKIVADCWKQGFVTVKRLDDVDNVGAYLTAYLGDLDVSEAEHVSENAKIKTVDYIDEFGAKKSKSYIKGGRLYMYPPGFHIFRYSNGIKMPDVSIVPYFEAKEKISAATLTFSKTIILADESNDYQNRLTYEYYNALRK